MSSASEPKLLKPDVKSSKDENVSQPHSSVAKSLALRYGRQVVGKDTTRQSVMEDKKVDSRTNTPGTSVTVKESTSDEDII